MQEPDDTDLLPLSRPPPSALPFVCTFIIYTFKDNIILFM